MPNDTAPIENRPITSDDLILAEMRQIAKDAIRGELEKQQLPLPRDSVLAAHIDALLSSRTDFRALAEERVAAKADAYTRALRAIGIEPIIVEAIEL